MDLQKFERDTEAMARALTLEDVDAELCLLPASPKNDEDLIARAVLMRRRIELVEGAKPPHEVDQAPIGDIARNDLQIAQRNGAARVWRIREADRIEDSNALAEEVYRGRARSGSRC